LVTADVCAKMATQPQQVTTMDIVNQTILRSLDDLPLLTDQELEDVQRALREQEQFFQNEIILMERHLMAAIGSIPADKGYLSFPVFTSIIVNVSIH
jgi:hypothetical protein